MNKFIFLLSILFFLFLPLVALQAGTCTYGAQTAGPCQNVSDCDPPYTCMVAGSSGGTVTLDNPLGKTTTPQEMIGKVINAALGIVGSLALAMFIYGGFMWMLSAGNNERVQKGKDIIMWATIGLIVIFASYAIVKQIFAVFK